jgi:hypothetical protein
VADVRRDIDLARIQHVIAIVVEARVDALTAVRAVITGGFSAADGERALAQPAYGQTHQVRGPVAVRLRAAKLGVVLAAAQQQRRQQTRQSAKIAERHLSHKSSIVSFK